MSNENKNVVKKEDNFDLTTVITNAIKIPGVKVTREYFLREQFKDLSKEVIELIVEKGPVEAGIDRETLRKKAQRIIKERSAISTSASFLAGLPGGWAMAATIPADILQFYGVALRMAQELVYLYGEKDLWCEGTPDPDKVTNQLILYCGVMLGATGAAQTVRIMSSALAKQALKKLPQKALSKTLIFSVTKHIVKPFGVKLTKAAFAKGVSKVIPVVGGLVSGTITLASMLPMGNRLLNTLDKAHFDYTEADLEADFTVVTEICKDEEKSEKEKANIVPQEDAFEKIQKAKQMLDAGVITEEEFAEIKAKLISQM